MERIDDLQFQGLSIVQDDALPCFTADAVHLVHFLRLGTHDRALDLGCGPRQAFFKVVVPEIMPGIMTGFLMALTYSIDDFVISYFTSGTVQTLPLAVYSMTRRKVSPEINALSAILFVVVLSILLIMNYKDIKGDKKLAKRERRL